MSTKQADRSRPLKEEVEISKTPWLRLIGSMQCSTIRKGAFCKPRMLAASSHSHKAEPLSQANEPQLQTSPSFVVLLEFHQSTCKHPKPNINCCSAATFLLFIAIRSLKPPPTFLAINHLPPFSSVIHLLLLRSHVLQLLPP